MSSTMTNALALIGRLLLAPMFLLAGYSKIGGFAGTAGWIASKGLPMPEVLTGAALVVELVAGVMLVLGWKARWAALALAGFTVLANYFFHNFWAMPEAQYMTQQLFFMKNIAVIGGLLLIAALGPGAWSIDRR
jgi:putative oxidoreductase